MEKDHMEIILEDINSKFDLALEGYSLMSSRFTETDLKIAQRDAETDFKIEALNVKMDRNAAEMNTGLKDLGQKIEDLTKVVGQQTTVMKELSDSLAMHRADGRAHGRYVVRED